MSPWWPAILGERSNLQTSNNVNDEGDAVQSRSGKPTSDLRQVDPNLKIT
jgi:hypothetical protein